MPRKEPSQLSMTDGKTLRASRSIDATQASTITHYVMSSGRSSVPILLFRAPSMAFPPLPFASRTILGAPGGSKFLPHVQHVTLNEVSDDGSAAN